MPHTHPANVEVSNIPKGRELGAMLESGEIDALISADVPKCILEKSPKVGRLFPDYQDVEREDCGRTGIFPIMHTAVIRKDLLEKHPELTMAAYQGFCVASGPEIEDIFAPQLLAHSEVTEFCSLMMKFSKTKERH